MQQITPAQIHLINAITFDNAKLVQCKRNPEAAAFVFDFSAYNAPRADGMKPYKFVMADKIQLARGKRARGLLTERQIAYLEGFCQARFNCDGGFNTHGKTILI